MKTSDREILKGYYLNHDAIRKDMDRLKIIASKMDTYQTKDIPDLHTWFKYHKQCILAHHHGEDGFFFPIMREQKPAFKTQIDAMEHEHIALDKGLHELNALFTKLNEGDRSAIEEFKRAADHYIHLVTNHLNSEELIVDSVIGEFPKELVLKTEKEYREKIPRSEMALLLPWMVDAMDEKDKKYFFGMVPFFVKWIYKFSARPKYQKMLSAI